jgi:hypothetical protein
MYSPENGPSISINIAASINCEEWTKAAGAKKSIGIPVVLQLTGFNVFATFNRPIHGMRGIISHKESFGY